MATLKCLVVAAVVCAAAGNLSSELDELAKAKQRVLELEQRVSRREDVGHPSLTVSDNNLNVRLPRDAHMTLTRRQSVDITELEGRVSSLENNAKTTAYKATVDATAALMGQVVTTMTTMQREQDAFQKQVNQDFVEKMAELNSNLDSFAASSSEDFSEFKAMMQSKINASVAEFTAQLQADSSKLKSEVATDIDDLTKTVSTLSSSVDDLGVVKNKYIWIGGSRNTYRHGWRDFPLDRVELDVGAPYFKREGNRFRVLKPGFFRLNYGGIMHGGWCHAHMDVRIDNKRVRDSTHNYIPGTWQWAEMENTFYVKANQQVWMRIYGCNYAIHGSGGYDAHNRLTFEFIGDRPKQCTGLYCNGI